MSNCQGRIKFNNVKHENAVMYGINNSCLPISFATSFSFDSVLDIRTTLRPCFANPIAYCLPIPSVDPVMTLKLKGIIFG